jgi:hypothetical protein
MLPQLAAVERVVAKLDQRVGEAAIALAIITLAGTPGERL